MPPCRMRWHMAQLHPGFGVRADRYGHESLHHDPGLCKDQHADHRDRCGAMNIVLDPILIFGFGMGVRGAAIATVLSQTVGAV